MTRRPSARRTDLLLHCNAKTQEQERGAALRCSFYVHNIHTYECVHTAAAVQGGDSLATDRIELHSSVEWRQEGEVSSFQFRREG